MSRPIIAITMGDPAGVGPEIIMKSLAHAELFDRCRPLVIGDVERLHQAACIVGVNLAINAVSKPSDGKYAPGTVDFFAIYIIPTDDWYIIPYAVVGDRDANLYFRPGVRGQKYGKYREAWHLLLDAGKETDPPPLEIRACCDDAEGIRTDVESFRLSRTMRKMFRVLFQV